MGPIITFFVVVVTVVIGTIVFYVYKTINRVKNYNNRIRDKKTLIAKKNIEVLENKDHPTIEFLAHLTVVIAESEGKEVEGRHYRKAKEFYFEHADKLGKEPEIIDKIFSKMKKAVMKIKEDKE